MFCVFYAYPQCELYHWIDVLDRFDDILESVAKSIEGKTWMFVFDTLPSNKDKDDVVRIALQLSTHVLCMPQAYLVKYIKQVPPLKYLHIFMHPKLEFTGITCDQLSCCYEIVTLKL